MTKPHTALLAKPAGVHSAVFCLSAVCTVPWFPLSRIAVQFNLNREVTKKKGQHLRRLQWSPMSWDANWSRKSFITMRKPPEVWFFMRMKVLGIGDGDIKHEIKEVLKNFLLFVRQL